MLPRRIRCIWKETFYMAQSPLPAECPRCRKILYPISTLRPMPRQTWLAKCGLLLAGTAMLVVEICLFYLVWVIFGIPIPGRLAVLIFFVPSLIVGIMVAVPFAWLPQVVHYRCASCGWWERFSISRTKTKRISFLTRGFGTSPVSAAQIQETFPHVPAPLAPDYTQVTNDARQYREAKFWASLQHARKRSAQEIARELQEAGWAEAVATAIVAERCKRRRKSWWE
jgi:hypothetical protein